MAAVKPRVPRGAAAMEFAIVAPLFLLLVIGIVYFGLALVAKYRLHGVASATVRSCVAQQQTGDSPATYQSCLSTQFPLLLARLGGSICDRPVPVGSFERITPGNRAEARTASLYLLKLQVTCTVNVNPINAMVPGGRTIVPGRLPITAYSAMPFVSAF